MYTLDTNSLIYLIKNDTKAAPIVEEILKNSNPIYISAITELELFGYSELTSIESGKIEDLLSLVTIMMVDSRVARYAGSLRRFYGIKTPDSTIAATALMTGSKLVTRNIKDFKRIENLELIKI